MRALHATDCLDHDGDFDSVGMHMDTGQMIRLSVRQSTGDVFVFVDNQLILWAARGILGGCLTATETIPE